MSDNVENLVLEHLRHIRGKVDQIADDVTDLKLRMSSLESTIVTVKHEIAHGDETDASSNGPWIKLLPGFSALKHGWN